MTRVLVLNGPNLNLLGTREPEIYGRTTLAEIEAGLGRRGAELGLEIDCFQSNHEGDLIDRLHERDFDWAIVNAGGLTHTSISLRDALKGVDRPFIEVHLSDPDQRESFRHVNYLHDIATDRIVGKGAAGYEMALMLIADRVRLEELLMTDELDVLRSEIDALDREIVGLLNRRARLGLEVGHAKRQSGRAIADPEREREVLLRIAAANDGPIPQNSLLALYRQLIETIRSLEELEDSGSKPALQPRDR